MNLSVKNVFFLIFFGSSLSAEMWNDFLGVREADFKIAMSNRSRENMLDLIANKLKSQEVIEAFKRNSTIFKNSFLENDISINNYLVLKIFENLKILFQTIDYNVGGHDSQVYSLAIEPGGRFFISGGECSTEDYKTPADLVGYNLVKLWQVSLNETFTLRKTFGWNDFEHRSSVYSLAMDSNGRVFASGDFRGLINVAKIGEAGRFIPSQKLGNIDGRKGSLISSLAFTSDGNFLVAGSWDFKVKIWELNRINNNFKLVQELSGRDQGHTSIVSSVVITSDGNRIFSASNDRTIKIWDKQSRGHFLNVQTLDLTCGGHSDAVNSLAITSNGDMLISASSDNTIKIWLKDLRGQFYFVQTLDLSSGGHTNSVKTLAISPDGNLLVSGSNDETIKIWERIAPNIFALIQTIGAKEGGHSDFVNCVAISSDKKTIISASSDSTIKVWKPITWRLTLTQAMFILTCFRSPDRVLNFSSMIESKRESKGFQLLLNPKEDLLRIFNSFSPNIKEFLLNRYVRL